MCPAAPAHSSPGIVRVPDSSRSGTARCSWNSAATKRAIPARPGRGILRRVGRFDRDTKDAPRRRPVARPRPHGEVVLARSWPGPREARPAPGAARREGGCDDEKFNEALGNSGVRDCRLRERCKSRAGRRRFRGSDGRRGRRRVARGRCDRRRGPARGRGRVGRRGRGRGCRRGRGRRRGLGWGCGRRCGDGRRRRRRWRRGRGRRRGRDHGRARSARPGQHSEVRHAAGDTAGDAVRSPDDGADRLPHRRARVQPASAPGRDATDHRLRSWPRRRPVARSRGDFHVPLPRGSRSRRAWGRSYG